jgi:hypothetical protein
VRLEQEPEEITSVDKYILKNAEELEKTAKSLPLDFQAIR